PAARGLPAVPSGGGRERHDLLDESNESGSCGELWRYLTQVNPLPIGTPATSRRCARPRGGARRAHRRSEADEWQLPVACCQRKTRVRIPNGIWHTDVFRPVSLPDPPALSFVELSFIDPDPPGLSWFQK